MAHLDKAMRQVGEILVEQGTITPLQLDEALQRQRLSGDLLGRILVSLGHADENDIIIALGMQQGMEPIDISKTAISQQDIIQLITAVMWRVFIACDAGSYTGRRAYRGHGGPAEYPDPGRPAPDYRHGCSAAPSAIRRM
jgi:hypothetical protein